VTAGADACLGLGVCGDALRSAGLVWLLRSSSNSWASGAGPSTEFGWGEGKRGGRASWPLVLDSGSGPARIQDRRLLKSAGQLVDAVAHQVLKRGSACVVGGLSRCRSGAPPRDAAGLVRFGAWSGCCRDANSWSRLKLPKPRGKGAGSNGFGPGSNGATGLRPWPFRGDGLKQGTA